MDERMSEQAENRRRFIAELPEHLREFATKNFTMLGLRVAGDDTDMEEFSRNITAREVHLDWCKKLATKTMLTVQDATQPNELQYQWALHNVIRQLEEHLHLSLSGALAKQDFMEDHQL